MEIEVRAYDRWMEDQVCGLFEMNYGVDLEDFRRFFRAFYERSFQEEHCIRLVALEGDRVVGFQSFFYWPMAIAQQSYRCYQSGNSLVHEDHRGKGVFGKLLKAGDLALEEKSADLLIGFPVNASLGSFVRAGWNAEIQIQWYIKPLSALNFFIPRKRGQKLDAADSVISDYTPTRLHSAGTKDFFSWRKGYHQHNYYKVEVEHDGARLCWVIRTSVRLKLLHELVIGEVYTDSENAAQLEILVTLAFEELRAAFRGFNFISFAINADSDRPVDQIIISRGFKPIDKQINFVYRKLNQRIDLPPASKWALYRGDIDTW